NRERPLGPSRLIVHYEKYIDKSIVAESTSRRLVKLRIEKKSVGLAYCEWGVHRTPANQLQRDTVRRQSLNLCDGVGAVNWTAAKPSSRLDASARFDPEHLDNIAQSGPRSQGARHRRAWRYQLPRIAPRAVIPRFYPDAAVRPDPEQV